MKFGIAQISEKAPEPSKTPDVRTDFAKFCKELVQNNFYFVLLTGISFIAFKSLTSRVTVYCVKDI